MLSLSSSWIRTCCLLVLLSLWGGGAVSARESEPDMIEEMKAEIERLQALPLPQGNVRITITRLEVESRNTTLLQALLVHRDPRFSADAGVLGGRNGLQIYGVGPEVYQADLTRGVSARREEQFLVLLPGTQASFEVTTRTRVPYTVVIPVYRGALVVSTFEEQVTGSGFSLAVTRAAPDGVEVELSPYFHGAERNRRIEVTDLCTTLLLRPGVPYVMASSSTREKNFATALLESGSGQASRQVILVIRADLGR